MTGRVTFNAKYALMTHNIENVSEQYQKALMVASSGKRINGPSDDPGAYRRILSGRTEQQRYEDYFKNLAAAVQELNQADSALGSATSSLSRARELAVSASGDTDSAESLEEMSVEVATLKEELVRIANSRSNSRYLFAGTASDASAYTDAGVYQGNDGVRQVIAGEDYTLDVSLTGDEIFGTASGGVDIFDALDRLEAAMKADDRPAIEALLTDLDAGLDQVIHSRTVYGARSNQATELRSFYEQQEVASIERVSLDEDADVASAYTDLARLNTTLQATLQVSATATRLSLLDYL